MFRHKIFNICNFFILAYCGRVALSAYNASWISALLMGIVLVMSLYFFVYANCKYALPKFMKVLNAFIVLLVIYGIVNIAFGPTKVDIEGNIENKNAYLTTALQSLLPIYSFYVFTRKGCLTVRTIQYMLPLFICLSVFEFTQMYQRRLLEASLAGSSRTEFTNNVGYVFLSLLPLIALPFKRKWIQYTMWAVSLIYILLAVKRGAILISFFVLIYFILFSLRVSTPRQKLIVLFLSILLISAGVYTLQDRLDNSEYFNSRIEDTRRGDTNSRNEIYSDILNSYYQETNILSIIFGRGANSTITISGFRAHNDWLQLLSDQGALGILIYICYFLALFSFWRSNKENEVVGGVIGIFIIVAFMRTLFSMSYADYSMYMSMAIGFSAAYVKKQPLLKR